MFAGIKLLWATQIHFDSSSLARVKMTLKGVQNIFMPKYVKCIAIVITLKGIEVIDTEKRQQKRVKIYILLAKTSILVRTMPDKVGMILNLLVLLMQQPAVP